LAEVRGVVHSAGIAASHRRPAADRWGCCLPAVGLLLPNPSTGYKIAAVLLIVKPKVTVLAGCALEPHPFRPGVSVGSDVNRHSGHADPLAVTADGTLVTR